jgi:hypothetical protein
MSVRRITTAVVALAATALAACGAERSADQVLSDTASGMGKIRSADLNLRLVLEPNQSVRAGRVGFALRGPLDLDTRGLPAARLRYTQIAGDKEGGATFISTGREAFVEVGGAAYRLPAERSRALETSAGAVRQNVYLPAGRWVREAKIDDGGTVGGVKTDHVTAQLDAVSALRDIFATMRSAGADAPDLRGAAADEVRDAVAAATIDIWSGREDHLLRRLRLRVDFQARTPAALHGRLGALAGVRLALDIDLDRVNQPVHVQAPAHPRPAAELTAGRQ